MIFYRCNNDITTNDSEPLFLAEFKLNKPMDINMNIRINKCC